MMKKQIILLLLTCFLSSVALAGSDSLNIFEEPRKMPDREFYEESGKKIKINKFKDDFVVMVFWSRHCMPCIKELDNLNNFMLKTKDDGIKVVAISPFGEWLTLDEERKFLQKFEAPDLEIYLDDNGDMAGDLGIFTYPHTVLINKKGEEIGRIRGAVEWDKPEVIEYIYKIKAQNG